jgi:hypothetical protein
VREVAKVLATEGGQWKLRAQLCRDLEANPVKDTSVAWPEKNNPYVSVAVITIPLQTSWTADGAAEFDDGLSFSPWHGIADHRPLGNIMRAQAGLCGLSLIARNIQWLPHA